MHQPPVARTCARLLAALECEVAGKDLRLSSPEEEEMMLIAAIVGSHYSGCNSLNKNAQIMISHEFAWTVIDRIRGLSISLGFRHRVPIGRVCA